MALALIHAPLQALHFVRDAKQRLDVVPDFMGDDVGLGEITRRIEAPLQFVIESQVDVDFFIQRAIERAHLRLADAAGGSCAAGKDHELRLLVILAEALEDLVPNLLGIGEHAADEYLHFIA